MESGTTDSGISLLNFDGTLQKQELLRNFPGEWIDFSDLRGCRGYCTGDSLRKIQNRLRARKHRRVTLIGHGNYHYVTYVLLSEIRQPFSLVLFDHHTDLAPGGDRPYLSCGSWVSHALETLPLLEGVVIVGARLPDGREAGDLPGKVAIISEQEARRMPPEDIVRAIRSSAPGLPLYISVDKDVLDPENAATDWDQGSMTLRQLIAVIRGLKRARPLAGADVCGEMPLSPVDLLSGERVKHLKKNERANQAIVDALLAG
jgi:arginase family enzyme